MRRYLKYISLILMIILSTIENSSTMIPDDKKISIAVLDISANSVKKSMSDGVRDMIEVELYKTGSFEILERNRYDLILKEKGLTASRCNNTKCAVSIGKTVSADKIIIGSVSRIDEITITIKLVDVKNGLIEYAEIGVAADEKAVTDTVRKLAHRIAEKVNNDYQKKIQSGKNIISSDLIKYYSLGIVPGLGQIYSGNRTRGYIFFGCFSVSAGFMGWSLYKFHERREEYENFSSGTNSELEERYRSSERAFKQAKVSIGIFSAVLIVNWIDILFFNSPPLSDNKRPETHNFYGYNRTGVNLDTVPFSGIETRINIYYSSSF